MVRISLFLILSYSLASCKDQPIPSTSPNILFIFVDDLGPEWISSYGADSIETPHVDALAASGMQFEAFYSMPQCTPSRVSFLTGQYPYHHGWLNHWDVPRWGAGCHFDSAYYHSIGRIMQAQGYRTAAAGKWQINDFRVQPDAMQQHGFEDYCMWTGGEGGNPVSDERYQNPYIHTKDGSRTYEGEFGPDIFTDFLIDFMGKSGDKPFFAYYPMVLTHTPLVPTPDEPDADTNLEKHKAMVRYMDKCVGRLIAALDSLGLREDTYVFFTTDNGSTRGITGYLNGRAVKGGKATLKEAGVREPFIVSRPGTVPEGVISPALVDITDLYPTFTEIAGGNIRPEFPVDGHSFLPALNEAGHAGVREWIMAMGYGPARLENGRIRPVQDFTDRIIRDKRYKVWIEDHEISRLYDLQKDPDEASNLIEQIPSEAEPALEKFKRLFASFPERDTIPFYDPLPPQAWDVDAEKHNARLRQ